MKTKQPELEKGQTVYYKGLRGTVEDVKEDSSGYEYIIYIHPTSKTSGTYIRKRTMSHIRKG